MGHQIVSDDTVLIGDEPYKIDITGIKPDWSRGPAILLKADGWSRWFSIEDARNLCGAIQKAAHESELALAADFPMTGE